MFISTKFGRQKTNRLKTNTVGNALKTNQPWWNEQSHLDLVSGPKIIEQWKIQLFGTDAPTPSQIQSVAALTQQLWEKFNTQRADLDRDYMSDEKSMQAYLASFFIPNIERCRIVFSHPEVSKILEKIVSLETIRILDFGSGPLSGSIGLLLALNDLKSSLDKNIFKSKKIEIFAAERSEKATKKGKHIIENSVSPEIEIVVSRGTSIPKDKEFDIVIAANVINEIPEKHKSKTLIQLAESLTSDRAHVGVVLEPGQEVHSKGLSELRDTLCGTNTLNVSIVAPCPHTKPCPLSPSTGRNDWCWFKSTFNTPDILSEIDKRSKIQHGELAYSYIAFTRSDKSEKSLTSRTLWAVAVSDEMSVGQPSDQEKRLQYYKHSRVYPQQEVDSKLLERIAANGLKTKLCARSGDFLAGLNSTDKPRAIVRRGQEIVSENEFEVIIKER